MATVLDYDIKFLPGVGEKRAGVLARELGIRTFGDLSTISRSGTSTARNFSA